MAKRKKRKLKRLPRRKHASGAPNYGRGGWRHSGSGKPTVVVVQTAGRSRGVHRGASRGPLHGAARSAHEGRMRRMRRGSGRRRGSRVARGRVAGRSAFRFAAYAVGAFVAAKVAEPTVNALAPTQEHVGVAPSGIVGAGLVAFGLLKRDLSPSTKELLVGVGTGFVANEVARQIDTRFSDVKQILGADGTPAIEGGKTSTVVASTGERVTVSTPPNPSAKDGDTALADRSSLVSRLTNDPNEKVRAFAASKLGERFQGDSVARAALSKAARDDASALVRGEALKALGFPAAGSSGNGSPVAAGGLSSVTTPLLAAGTTVGNFFTKLKDDLAGTPPEVASR